MLFGNLIGGLLLIFFGVVLLAAGELLPDTPRTVRLLIGSAMVLLGIGGIGYEFRQAWRGSGAFGVTVVLVTHDAAHAAWADRVVYLRDGQLA